MEQLGQPGQVRHSFTHLHGQFQKQVKLYDHYIDYGSRRVPCEAVWTTSGRSRTLLLRFTIHDDRRAAEALYTLVNGDIEGGGTVENGLEIWFCSDHGGQYLTRMDNGAWAVVVMPVDDLGAPVANGQD